MKDIKHAMKVGLTAVVGVIICVGPLMFLLDPDYGLLSTWWPALGIIWLVFSAFPFAAILSKVTGW